MREHSKWLVLCVGLVVATAVPGLASAAKHAKKRLLLVTTSVGFRHPSAGFASEVVKKLALDSGEFEVVSTADDPDFPVYPAPQDWETAGKQDAGPPNMPNMPSLPGGPPGAGSPPGAGGPPGAGDAPGGPPGMNVPGSAGSPEVLAKVTKVLAKYMTADALQKFDAVFFVNTNGELPLPDPKGFLDWLKAGHGYVGTHSASDTLHKLEGYPGAIGGEFQGHGRQEVVDLHVDDATNPMTAGFKGKSVQSADDEWYLFKSSYDREQVHSLYSMTQHPNQKTPGHYPVAWCKVYGKGRVYYTSQGHRFDIWDIDWVGSDGLRTNSAEAVAAFRAGLLAGMRWAAGLTQADCSAPAATR